jgi:hypothetical protein
MNRKQKHTVKTTPWSRFRDYFSNVLAPDEMHKVERKVLSDPFEKDAYDGFEIFAPASVENDLNLLKERLKRKNGFVALPPSKTKFPIRSIAAVLAVIIITPLVFWLVTKSDKQLSVQTETTRNKELAAIATDDTMMTDSIIETVGKNESIALLKDDNKVETALETPTYIYEKKEKSPAASVSVKKVVEEPLKPIEVKRSSQPIVSQPLFAETTENEMFIEQEMLETNALQGSIEGITTAMPAQLTTNINETATTNDRTRQGSVATKPQPTASEYNSKIKAAVSKAIPEIKGISTIEFTINTKGEPENFNVRQSIDAKADRQIIREIKRAGKWIPAYYLSEPIESVTTLTIVF